MRLLHAFRRQRAWRYLEILALVRKRVTQEGLHHDLEALFPSRPRFIERAVESVECKQRIRAPCSELRAAVGNNVQRCKPLCYPDRMIEREGQQNDHVPEFDFARFRRDERIESLRSRYASYGTDEMLFRGSEEIPTHFFCQDCFIHYLHVAPVVCSAGGGFCLAKKPEFHVLFFSLEIRPCLNARDI